MLRRRAQMNGRQGDPEPVFCYVTSTPGQVGVSSMKFGDQEPPEETEDRFSMPLIITIVCMASFLLLVAALYGCCHQRLSQRKDQVRTSHPCQSSSPVHQMALTYYSQITGK